MQFKGWHETYPSISALLGVQHVKVYDRDHSNYSKLEPAERRADCAFST